MDLGAYSNIEDLDKIASDNNINVPRLRGYRLMKDEKPINIEEWCDGIDTKIVENLCESVPFWTYGTGHYLLSYERDRLKYKYLIFNKDNWSRPIKVLWNKIHGKKRKVLKTAIHNETKSYKLQANTFNKYVGRDDILYIHARIGGGNWNYYHQYVVNEPWFIEKVDDAFDSTYCDIYARIKPITQEDT